VATTEFGAVREIWLATLAEPTTKYSFLIRDDAFTKSGALFGRTLRLGDPVTTGPLGTWRQTSWVGGKDQKTWRDEEMYDDATADTYTETGKVQLHRCLGSIYGENRTNVNRYALGRTASSASPTEVVSLLIGEDNTANSNVPSGGFRLMYSTPGVGVTNLKTDFDAGVRAFSPVDDNSAAIYVGLANGKVWRLAWPGGWTLDYTDDEGGIAPNGMAAFGDSLYWLAGPVVRKRYWSGSRATQSVYINGVPTGGTFTLTFGGQTTGAIAYNASTAAVQSALEALSNIAPGDVVVSGSAGVSYTLTFGGVYASTTVPVVSATSSLTGGTNASVTVAPVGTGLTHTIHARPPGAMRLSGIAKWNNRLWFGSMTYGHTCRIYVSDGASWNEAFQFPEEFELEGMVPYKGSLYLYGGRGSADRTSRIGQVWRYTGSSLQKVWQSPQNEEGDAGNDGSDRTVYDAVVHDDILYWSLNGHVGNAYTYGVMAYDASLDAIYRGPTEVASGATTVRSVDLYNQTVVVAAKEPSTMAVRPVAEFNVVKRTTADVEQWVLSSRYDADLPGEEKDWIRMRVRCKVPGSGTSIVVKVILDDNWTEETIGTISYDAGATNWRTVTLPMKVDGEYLRSTVLRYKLYVKNTHASAGSTRNPMVDSVEVDFLPAPTTGFQWRVRAICSDDQDRLDGSSNSLSTRAELEGKLEEFWTSQAPFLYWDAGSEGGAPSGDGTEVRMTEYNASSYRVDSIGETVNSEVSLGFFEVV